MQPLIHLQVTNQFLFVLGDREIRATDENRTVLLPRRRRWLAHDVRKERLINPGDLVRHDLFLGRLLARDMIEHEADEVRLPRFNDPFSYQLMEAINEIETQSV